MHTTTAERPRKYKFEYKPNMLMNDFVQANYAYYEQRFVEDFPMKFV